MIVLLSPAKSINIKELPKAKKVSTPLFLDDSETLMTLLKPMRPKALQKLMSINDKIALENFERNQIWHKDFDKKEAFPASHIFMGDVYRGLGARDFDGRETTRAQKSIRILSGLHGLLKPMDLIMPYRLEMGSRLKNLQGKDLYSFWQEKLTNQLKLELKALSNPVVINLASIEYSLAINLDALNCKVITPSFKEWRNGKWVNIQFNMKRARGLLARYIVKENCKSLAAVKRFHYEKYEFNKKLSKGESWVFTR